jgi:hypothetical protein
VRREGRHHLACLALGHAKGRQAALQLGRDLVELLGRDRELAVGFLEPDRGPAGLRGDVLLGPAGDFE